MELHSVKLKPGGPQTALTDKRPKLDKLLASLGRDDVLAVWRLDRLGRSLPHLIQIVRDLEGQGAHLQSLTEGIDTTTAQGRLTFHLMGGLCCKLCVPTDYDLFLHSSSRFSILKMVFEHGHRFGQGAGTDAEGSFDDTGLAKDIV